MKKRLVIIIAMVLALSLITINTFAAPRENEKFYTDRNNDGICDNAQAEKPCPQNKADFGNGNGACRQNGKNNTAPCGKNYKN